MYITVTLFVHEQSTISTVAQLLECVGYDLFAGIDIPFATGIGYYIDKILETSASRKLDSAVHVGYL